MPQLTARQQHTWYSTPRWAALRGQALASDPFCRRCLRLGRRTRATVVVHVRAHHGSEALFFNRVNVSPFCPACVDRLDALIERNKRRVVAGKSIDAATDTREPVGTEVAGK
jgi:hypothetical protein